MTEQQLIAIRKKEAHDKWCGIDWICYRIVMAWPLPLPDCRESRLFARLLARAGKYANTTPNQKPGGA